MKEGSGSGDATGVGESIGIGESAGNGDVTGTGAATAFDLGVKEALTALSALPPICIAFLGKGFSWTKSSSPSTGEGISGSVKGWTEVTMNLASSSILSIAA